MDSGVQQTFPDKWNDIFFNSYQMEVLAEFFGTPFRVVSVDDRVETEEIRKSQAWMSSHVLSGCFSKFLHLTNQDWFISGWKTPIFPPQKALFFESKKCRVLPTQEITTWVLQAWSRETTSEQSSFFFSRPFFVPASTHNRKGENPSRLWSPQNWTPLFPLQSQCLCEPGLSVSDRRTKLLLRMLLLSQATIEVTRRASDRPNEESALESVVVIATLKIDERVGPDVHPSWNKLLHCLFKWLKVDFYPRKLLQWTPIRRTTNYGLLLCVLIKGILL